jgi:hypothetical protein
MEEKRWRPLIALIRCSYWWRNKVRLFLVSGVTQKVSKMLAGRIKDEAGH